MIHQLPSGGRRAAPALLAALVLAALVLAALLAACGGASGAGNEGVVSLASPSASPDPSASPAASVDPEEALQAFTACMKAHGVDVQVAIATEGGSSGTIGGPSLSSAAPGTAAKPQEGSGEFDPKKMEEADKACRGLLPSGMQGDPNATIPPEQVEQMLGFAKCMREHGFDFPDPQFSGNGMSVQIGGPDSEGGPAIDPASPEFQAAQKDCGSAMPGGAPFVVGGSSVESQP
jgi:hypothetical protein